MAGPPKLKRPPTFDHLRKKAPLERTVEIPLNDAVVAAYEAAQEALRQAELTKEGVEEARADLEAARRALEAETVTLRFRAIGRKRYEELLRAHPPAKGEATDADYPFDFDTFSVALIAASCVEPEMT